MSESAKTDDMRKPKSFHEDALSLADPEAGLYEGLLETSSFAFIFTDKAGCITYGNSKACALLECSPSELIGCFLSDNLTMRPDTPVEECGIDPSLFLPFKHSNQDCLDECRGLIVSRTGKRFSVSICAFQLKDRKGERTGSRYVIKEDPQRQTWNEFEHLVENAPAVLYRCACDAEWTPEFVSDGIRALAGYHASDFIDGRVSFNSIIFPDDREKVAKVVMNALAKRMRYEVQYRLIHREGRLVTVVEYGSGIFHPVTGHLQYLDGLILDKVEALEDKEELREKDNFVQKFTSLTPEMIFVHNLEEGHLTYCNERSMAVLGYDPEAMLGMKRSELISLVHPDDIRSVAMAFTQSKSLLDNEYLQFEFRLRHRNGHWIFLKERMTVFRRSSQGSPCEVLGIIDDITQEIQTRHDLNEQRQKSIYASRMASLGEVAGGIAHEINNPLAIIHASAEKIKIFSRGGDRFMEQIIQTSETILQTADRIAKIIRGLRFFARDGSQDPLCSVSVRKVIASTLVLCESKLAAHCIELAVTQPEHDVLINGREVQLSQVMLNLVGNAADAVESVAEKKIAIEVSESNEVVQISVADSGPGIAQGLENMIMEPFFTTKGIGKGTGLGLSISSSIAAAHGGELFLDRSSAMTCFVLKLPKPHL